MQLFGSYTSPFVRHTRIVVKQTNIACEFVETDISAATDLSPTMKLPFFKDSDHLLTDSATIIRYLRESQGQDFLADIRDFDLFALINTLMDSVVNVFQLERAGIAVGTNTYLQRQVQRVDTGMRYLNQLTVEKLQHDPDVNLRLACFLDWLNFRKRYDFSALANLNEVLADNLNNADFCATAPPQ